MEEGRSNEGTGRVIRHMDDKDSMTCPKYLQDIEDSKSHETHAALDYEYRCELSSDCGFSFLQKFELGRHLLIAHVPGAHTVEGSLQEEGEESDVEEYSPLVTMGKAREKMSCSAIYVEWSFENSWS